MSNEPNASPQAVAPEGASLPHQTEKEKSQGGVASNKQTGPGLIISIIGFLDRNLRNFSQPARDTIAIGLLLVVIVYVLNGVLGPTYVRGQLWVDGRHAIGYRVLHGDSDAISNENGWWTLPLSGNGIPGPIRIEVEGNPDGNGVREPMGQFRVVGPWPIWNTFRPMDDYTYDVHPDRPRGNRLELRSVLAFPTFLGTQTVLAQGTASVGTKAGNYDVTSISPDLGPCALSLNEVRVNELPGWPGSSRRGYFQIYMDDKPIDGKMLLHGGGIGLKPGKFPVESEKELWLPLRAGSDDRYTDLVADLSDVAHCVTTPSGTVQIQPKGHITMKMYAAPSTWWRSPELLNTFDLDSALKAPNQETQLRGEANTKGWVKVEPLAKPSDGSKSSAGRTSETGPSSAKQK